MRARARASAYFRRLPPLLGGRYEHGKGVEQNNETAVRWYRKSAEGGHSDASFNLGVLFQTGGLGLEESDEAALKWYLRAADSNHSAAQTNIG